MAETLPRHCERSCAVAIQAWAHNTEGARSPDQPEAARMLLLACAGPSRDIAAPMQPVAENVCGIDHRATRGHLGFPICLNRVPPRATAPPPRLTRIKAARSGKTDR